MKKPRYEKWPKIAKNAKKPRENPQITVFYTNILIRERKYIKIYINRFFRKNFWGFGDTGNFKDERRYLMSNA